ncbi:ATP-binding protein [Haloprofundus sp. MHR1]|uniref:ATP-binding protein n=1 Tax=Haloprofundus sp. MHR1 TaxID=2572921 RepID=UPI0010BF3B74|nr:ATP-binding protein [Haloprofundus sp. MHR1]QCJ45657.1 ATP-binding protein [Haloprofundus sp. MHR1]
MQETTPERQTRKRPKVNEVNEFLEIASDFEDPLEVIREALSNSYDAGATEVEISIKSRAQESEIIIEDNGRGMSESDLESFFDLGNSTKSDPEHDSIGYKGHGTKILYKSNQIIVDTAHEGKNLHAVMDEPWETLNNRELPEYEVTESATRPGNDGTRIKVTGFKSGRGFAPESLTYNKIEHYLKWKTLAGSTKYHFHPEQFREIEITVRLDNGIDDSRERLVTNNKLEFPEEQLDPGEEPFPEARMCKHYGPKTLQIEADNGEKTELEVVGMVGGKDARDELPTYGRHSAQFGIWLAKDHIKVERLNEAISHDNEFIHFLFIANSQDIELSANREKIRNKSSAIYQAIEKELNYFLSKIAADPWFKGYLEQRRVAELNRKASTQQKSVEERKKAVTERGRFEATNQSEVILGLERSNREGAKPTITVEDFDLGADVNALVEQNGRLYGSSVHLKLTDHFEEDKPLESVGKILCWEIGDRDKLREIERRGYQNGHVEFDLKSNRITYGTESRHTIHIVEVRSRFD